MLRHDSSCGGEEEGMTDMQFKGMLLDQLDDLKRILKLAEAADNTAVIEEVESQIAKLNKKLQF